MKNKRQRVIFVNLHGNEFLVKTLNKIIFGQSVAIKHKYFLDYLLSKEDVEVCTYINKRGLSLSYTTTNPLLQSFRFVEHKIAMRKNGIPIDKVTVLKHESEIQPDDILITYCYYGKCQYDFDEVPDALRVVSQIHFGTGYSEKQRQFDPQVMYNESNLMKYSGMWQRDLSWFNKEFVTMPFVFEPRFQRNKPFEERCQKGVSVGTITYMHNITNYYGDPCAQPARRNCRILSKERPELIDSFNFDYSEDQQDKKLKPTKNPIVKICRRLHSKVTGGHQKQYYSFNMVDKLNDYKIAVVGEEIMGIPGIGFVEAMACGCAYIGQTIGYYEDMGLKEGVHYIGYDGTKEGLARTIEYWMRDENQKELEKIANAGYEFVRKHFNKNVVAENLYNNLRAIKGK